MMVLDELVVDDLPDITTPERLFIQELLVGKSATEAYRLSHPNTKASGNALWVQASRERAKPKVQLWLRALRLCALETGSLSLERRIAELTRLRELAISQGELAAAVQAEVQKGKAIGLYEDRLRLAVSTSDAELIKALKGALGQETAETIRAALGMSLQYDQDAVSENGIAVVPLAGGLSGSTGAAARR